MIRMSGTKMAANCPVDSPEESAPDPFAGSLVVTMGSSV